MSSPTVSPDGATPLGPVDASAVAEAMAAAQGMNESGNAADTTAPSGPDESASARSDDTPSPDVAEGAEHDPSVEADDAAAAEDARDLEQYPESVRDYLKGIPREHRKTLHEHFGQRERAQMLEEQKRAADLKAKADAEQAERDRIVATQGKFVGEAPIELTDADGNTVEGPTYSELKEALGTRRGREQLWSKYGLTEDGAEAVKAELDQRRDMLAGSAKLMDDAAWGKLAGHVLQALEQVPGIDPAAILGGTSGPQEWLPRLIQAVDARHEAEKAEMRATYEGRIDTTNVNAEALRKRTVAAESRRMPTGGRTGGTATRTIDRLRAEAGSDEQFAANAAAGMYVGIDLTK